MTFYVVWFFYTVYDIHFKAIFYRLEIKILETCEENPLKSPRSKIEAEIVPSVFL